MVTIKPKKRTKKEIEKGKAKHGEFLQAREKAAGKAKRKGASPKEARAVGTAAATFDDPRKVEQRAEKQARENFALNKAKTNLEREEIIKALNIPSSPTGPTNETKKEFDPQGRGFSQFSLKPEDIKARFGEQVQSFKEVPGEFKQIAGELPGETLARVEEGDPQTAKALRGLALGGLAASAGLATGLTQAEVADQQIRLAAEIATQETLALKQSRITIGQTAIGHEVVDTKTGGVRVVGRGTIFKQRNVVGKGPVNSPVDKLFDKLGSEQAQLAAKYQVNPVTQSLSTKWLVGLGLTTTAAGIITGAVGSYAFAQFVGKEEAAQALGLPMWEAYKAGDLVGMETLLEASNELVSKNNTIADALPSINVAKAVSENIEAVGKANIEWARLLELKKQELGLSEAPQS